MSKASRNRRRKARQAKTLPWKVKRDEGMIHAFLRQASEIAIKDYHRLRKEIGYAQLDAAREAWETDHA